MARKIHHFGEALGRDSLLAGTMRVTGWGKGDARMPLAVIFLGFGFWWVLGVTAVVPLVVAGALAVSLLRRREPLHLPPGASFWFLFLIWVALGAFVLGVDAPGAAPGGDGSGRLMVFGYRLLWYLTCTVILVWLGNTRRRDLPDRSVYAMIAFIFVLTTAGGLLGLLAPSFEFTSALETVLPHGLRANSFVASMVHPQAADVQMALGRPEARPKAPFSFTNTWGSVMALSAVFAVAWAVTGSRRSRVVVGLTATVASVPVVFSLNRGLWGCVVLGLVGVVILAVRNGRVGHLLVGATVGVAAIALAAGPLLALVNERLDNPHSNERRGQLAGATVSSVNAGSPLIGFGTTRDVQGSFASISGGSTPDCPACGVPPLGTQGHFWLVLFSQGWIGVALFLAFLGTGLSRSWRCRSPNETLCTFVLAFFALQIFVYDTLGLPLLLVFLAIGLVWREHRETRPEARAWTSAQLAERVRKGAPVAVALTVLGAGVSMAVASREAPQVWGTTVQLVLTSPPDPYSPALIGDVLGEQVAGARDLRITIDTEAALLLSESTLKNAVSTLGPADATLTPFELRAGIRISAEPNTQVLVLDVSGPTASESARRGRAVATTYLSARQRYVDERRTDLLTRLNRDLRAVLPQDPTTATLLLRLNAADRKLRADTTSVGRIITVSQPRRVPQTIAVRTTSGAALGMLVGVVTGAFVTPRPRRRRAWRPAPFKRLSTRTGTRSDSRSGAPDTGGDRS